MRTTTRKRSRFSECQGVELGRRRRRRVLREHSSTSKALANDEEDDDEYQLSEAEQGEGAQYDVNSVVPRRRQAARCRIWCARGCVHRHLLHAGSDCEDSLGGCLPVPSDEVLDLVDEQSASESEVCTSTHPHSDVPFALTEQATLSLACRYHLASGASIILNICCCCPFERLVGSARVSGCRAAEAEHLHRAVTSLPRDERPVAIHSRVILNAALLVVT